MAFPWQEVISYGFLGFIGTKISTGAHPGSLFLL